MEQLLYFFMAHISAKRLQGEPSTAHSYATQLLLDSNCSCFEAVYKPYSIVCTTTSIDFHRLCDQVIAKQQRPKKQQQQTLNGLAAALCARRYTNPH